MLYLIGLTTIVKKAILISVTIWLVPINTYNMKVCDFTIGNSECEKLLGVKIDVNLNFNEHISDLCKKS